MKRVTTPIAVKRYLGARCSDERRMAYLRVRHDKCVELCGGDLMACGIGAIDKSNPIDEQLDSLVGLLPAGDKPVVISNAQTLKNLFVDLHVFSDSGEQWIVMFDNSEAARELQIEQQERLSKDIVLEKHS